MTFSPKDDAPLGRSDIAPVLFPALGVFFQLSPLGAGDEPRLDQACDLVWDWIGEHLSWTWYSFAPDMERASRRTLDFVAGHTLRLREPPEIAGDPEADIIYSNLYKTTRDDFYVMCTGGEHPSHGSPYTVRFWCEIPKVRQAETYQTRAFLQVTVPLSHPLALLRDRATALASLLRIQWGNAGHAYATWEPTEQLVQRRKTFAHARRFLGFDTGYSIRMEPFHEAIRTVSWLTFVGEPLLQKLGGPLPAVAAPLEVTSLPGALRVQAGPAPDAGDRNRLDYPAAYIAADKLLRPVRAKAADFAWPWAPKTTEDWLSRLDRRFS